MIKLRLYKDYDKKALSSGSFLFLLVSDFFILWLLFFGLSEQISQLSSEFDYFPYRYRSMLIEKTWVENNIIDKICSSILAKNRSINENDEKVLHPELREIENMLLDISTDNDLYTAFESYKRLKNNYEALPESHEQAVQLLSILENEKKLLSNNPRVAKVCSTVFKYQSHNYVQDIKNFKRWFAVKRVLIDAAFLIPLVILLLGLHTISVKRKWPICFEVSRHYVFLSFIPILFEVIRLIIEIFPEELLKEVYDFLRSIKLISIWYYSAVLIFVVIVIFIMRLFQTRLFTKQRSCMKSYLSGRCMNCNAKTAYNTHFCPVCGYPLVAECPSCKKITIKNLSYCMNCGCKLDEHKESLSV